MEGIKFLKDCVDYHLHVSPSAMTRYCDLVEMAKMAEEAGYRAIVHKDHHQVSEPLASMLKKYLFADSPIQIFGSMSLNNSVGGLSPAALKVALDYGVRVVWLPTASAKNHIEFMKQGVGGFPKMAAGRQIVEKPIVLIDESGELIDDAKACLDLLSDYPKVAIGTGHGTPEEVDAVVKYCAKLGILNRVFVDHPNIIIRADMDYILKWADMGAYIEFAAATSCPPNNDVPIAEFVDMVRAVCPERVAMASDLGGKANGNPVEAFARFLNQLHEAGISEDDLYTMTAVNPAKMLSLD